MLGLVALGCAAFDFGGRGGSECHSGELQSFFSVVLQRSLDATEPRWHIAVVGAHVVRAKQKYTQKTIREHIVMQSRNNGIDK